MISDNDRAKRVATANESREDLATDEEIAKLEKAKMVLKARLDNGEITGAQYNRELIALTVPEKKKERPHVQPKKWTLAILIAIIIVSMIPAVIYLYGRFSFQNTLKTDGVANYYENFSPSSDREPIQIKVEGKENGIYKGRKIAINYEYYYDITAVVASVKDYWGLGDYDTLAPRDVCLVWGGLMDAYLRGNASFTQGGRFCYPVIDGQEYNSLDVAEVRGAFGNKMLALHEFSNNHIIPSTVEIRRQVFGLKKGSEVRLSGYLVNVQYGEMYIDSSTTRNDYGNGACEVFYVTKVDKL